VNILINLVNILLFWFEAGSYYVAQAGLELMILLLQHVLQQAWLLASVFVYLCA
jgi:hypothetical protein